MTTEREAAVENLGPAECRRLLDSARLARIGFTDRALPAIVPVRFRLHDGCALIPASPSGTLVDRVRGSVVALQVDSYRDDLGPGWSVTAVGPSRVVVEAHEVARIHAFGLFAGTSFPDDCYIKVQLGLLRGWRVGPPEGETPLRVGNGDVAMI